MSGFNTPSAVAPQQPKQMSSRLATMKFMQRSTSSPRSQPQTPSSEPPSKRRRTDTTSLSAESRKLIYHPSSNTGFANGGTDADRQIIYNVKEGSETQWTLKLNLPATNVHEDSDDEASDSEDDIWSSSVQPGRQTYGSYKRKKRTTTTATPSTSINVDNDADLGSVSEADSDSDSKFSSTSPAQDTPGSFARKRKAPTDFDDDHRLDRIDLSKSSYARAKGAYTPNSRDRRDGGKSPGRGNGFGGGGEGGRYGKTLLNPNRKKARKTL